MHMTAGQKIQHYRKLQGLSQEELGAKLLVSRQTVSLWENDQTLPTIDNLVRLKEIFGVSIDEILCQQTETADAPAPLEQYVFTYTAAGHEKVRKVSEKNRIKKMIMPAALMFLIWLFAFGWENFVSSLIGFALGFGGVIAISLARNKKIWKKHTQDVIHRVYHYDVYADYVYLRIFLEGQLVNAQKIPLAEMKLFADTEDVLIYSYDYKLQIYPKNQLLPDSLLWKAGRPIQAPARLEKEVKLLFWASVALAVVSVVWFFHLSWDMELLVAQIWYCFLALPVPIAAIVLGIILKVKGGKGIRNVVVGVIAAALLLLFGSLSLIFEDFDLNFMDPAPNPPYISTIEQYTGIDIPEHSSVQTIDFSDSPLTGTWTTHYVSSTIFFDAAAVETFEQEMKTDPRWMTMVKNELVGILPHDGNVYITGRYVLIYNIDLEQWNQVPPKSGKYHMLFLTYDPEGNAMNASEYVLDYLQ